MISEKEFRDESVYTFPILKDMTFDTVLYYCDE